MYDLCSSGQAPKRQQAGLSSYGERQSAVVKIPAGSFGNHGYLEPEAIVHGAEFRQARRQRHHNGLNAANVRCEGMRVQKQLHSESLCAALRAESEALAGTVSEAIAPCRPRATPRVIASTAASIFSRGDQDSIRARAALPIADSCPRF